VKEFMFFDDNLGEMVTVLLPEEVLTYIEFLEQSVLVLEESLADEKVTKFTTLN